MIGNHKQEAVKVAGCLSAITFKSKKVIGNELYIKVLEKEGLRSLNTDYAFMDFSNAEQTVYIIGKVIGKISPEDEATEDDVEMFLEVKKRMGE